MNGPIRRVLVANRGEIAVRIVRACHDEGLEAVVAVSDADVDSRAAQLADDVVHIGAPSPASSYLREGQIVAGALLAQCDAIHPGYGFLSERPALAEACVDNGLIFVGPPADAIRRGGDKVAARECARLAGVPIGAGSDAVADANEAASVASRVGFPVLLKAAAGGGGRGMVLVPNEAELFERFSVASNEALTSFGDGRLYVERFVEHARHVEVQLMADTHGHLVHLGHRDCSVQRRYQKVVEEATASAVPPDVRERIAQAAVALGRELGYVGAGTVEFLLDIERNEFSFLEVNTRVQVEHPVTEMVTGIDIVREQLRVAAGATLSFTQDEVAIDGHAIEFRINAESPTSGFVPSPGRLTTWRVPEGPGIRIDTHAFEGYVVPRFYDSLIAKLIVHGRDRAQAIERARAALDTFAVAGIDTNIELHRKILDHRDFVADTVDTRWLERVFLPEFERTDRHNLEGAR
jgi:acetyl-CoA carboxylase, biotin carboxylase subunit